MINSKIIWQVSDNKRGHENQCSGLIRALSRQVALEVAGKFLVDNHSSG
jgi:uncharacterized membrane protein affecting hemolysin expression